MNNLHFLEIFSAYQCNICNIFKAGNRYHVNIKYLVNRNLEYSSQWHTLL